MDSSNTLKNEMQPILTKIENLLQAAQNYDFDTALDLLYEVQLELNVFREDFIDELTAEATWEGD